MFCQRFRALGSVLNVKGGLCGSALLNLHFRDVFAKHIGRWFEAFVEEWGRPYTEESREAFLDTAVADFEIEKRNFDGFSKRPEDKKMNIHIRGILESENMGRDTRRGRIMIPRQALLKS